MSKKQKPDYTKLKHEARTLFFKGVNQKEIATTLKVSAVTVSNWCTDGGWKSEREARLDSEQSKIENIQQVIDNLVKLRLSLIYEIEAAECAGNTKQSLELQRKQKGIADEISKLRKEKEDIRGEGKKRITLSDYLFVMDSIFRSLQVKSPEKYRDTLDFQEEHVAEVSKIYG